MFVRIINIYDNIVEVMKDGISVIRSLLSKVTAFFLILRHTTKFTYFDI